MYDNDTSGSSWMQWIHISCVWDRITPQTVSHPYMPKEKPEQEIVHEILYGNQCNNIQKWLIHKWDIPSIQNLQDIIVMVYTNTLHSFEPLRAKEGIDARGWILPQLIRGVILENSGLPEAISVKTVRVWGAAPCRRPNIGPQVGKKSAAVVCCHDYLSFCWLYFRLVASFCELFL